MANPGHADAKRCRQHWRDVSGSPSRRKGQGRTAPKGAPIRLQLLVASRDGRDRPGHRFRISGDSAFDRQALRLDVQLARFHFDEVVLGPTSRRAAWWFAILISRPVFLEGLLLVGRGHGTYAAHCTTMA
jgi:hypothetical protein